MRKQEFDFLEKHEKIYSECPYWLKIGKKDVRDKFLERFL
jgi:hypothetical protein